MGSSVRRQLQHGRKINGLKCGISRLSLFAPNEGKDLDSNQLKIRDVNRK